MKTQLYFRQEDGTIKGVFEDNNLNLKAVRDQKQITKDIKGLGLKIKSKTPVLCLMEM